MEWYLKVVRDNYANFNGRARRKEYWMFILFNAIIGFVLGIIEGIFGLRVGDDFTGAGILSGIYSLIIIIPGLAVAVRRLHDTGRSGWNYLWVFTIIGVLYVLYCLVIEGDKGPNKYGEDPKGDENVDPFAESRSDVFPGNKPE